MPLFGPPDVEKLKAKGDVQGLIKAMLNSKEKLVCEKSARALGELRDSRAIEPLIIALQDSDKNVRHTAVWALGELGDARAVEPLIQARMDNSDQFTDRSVNQASFEALKKIGPPAIEQAIMILKDNASRARRGAAVEVLGLIGDARAVEPLITALSDTNQFFQSMAAQALGKIGDLRAVEPLIGKLNDDNLIGVAAEALGKLEDTRALEPLINKFEGFSFIRSHEWFLIAEAIAHLGGTKMSGLFIAIFLEDQRAYADTRRQHLAYLLGEIGDSSTALFLIKALYGDYYDPRRTKCMIIEALGKIGARETDIEIRAKVTEHLMSKSKEIYYPDIHTAAVNALKGMR